MKHDVLPSVEDVEIRGPDPAREIPDPYELERQLEEATRAAGPEATMEALHEVAIGEANPEALLAWMDDLRDPERNEHADNLAKLQEGVVPDFIADTELAGGAQEVRDPAQPLDSVEDAKFFAGKEPAEVPDTSDDDADYFFSAVRKRRGDSDEPDDDGAPDDGDDKKDSKPTKKKSAR